MENQLSLSDAVLAGIELSPIQVTGKFIDVKNHASCGLGCAYLAVAPKGELITWDTPILPRLYERFPQLKNVVESPKTGRYELLATIITTLNDVHNWSREEIAQWLKTINL